MNDALVFGPATISMRVFRQVLENRTSPALWLAPELYNVCIAWGINPAVPLAFFVHESTAGTKGVATETKNWGNLRSGFAEIADTGGFAKYASWVVSLNDWCKTLSGSLYRGSGLLLVSQIIPRYAPAADHNNVQAYIDDVNRNVGLWEQLTLRGE